MTWKKIETQVLTSPAGTITFNSVGGYKDLVVIITGIQVSSANSLRIRVGNGSLDTGSNYTVASTFVAGSAVQSSGEDATSAYSYNTGDGTSTMYTNWVVQFIDYANTTTYKRINSMGGRANVQFCMDNSIWKNTGAITVISFAMGAGFPSANFETGTKAILYGVR